MTYDRYKVEGPDLLKAEWPSEQFKWIGSYGTPERAQEEKTLLEATDAIFDATQDGRQAWQRLLKLAFPNAKLCNCQDGLYGCKYGCEWNMNRTKEAVAAELLKRGAVQPTREQT